ncbi:MAG TPA: hypothetical protein PKA88_01095, partial [Polyangiaceae bacterium]|nr:hypothetical protein [Polyangiaceae bacterium]
PVFGPTQEDTRSPFEKLAQVWSARIGGAYQHVYTAAAMETYFGGVRDDASPRVLQFELGYSGAGREWSEGGTGVVRHTSYEDLDQFGNPCPKIDKNDSAEEAREKMRGIRCDRFRATTSSTPVSYGSAWLDMRYAFYGGWRHISDFLGGESPDGSLPLVDGGGPLFGAVGVVKRGALTALFSHEFAFYVHGWDDHGKLGYSGNLAAGVYFFLVDLRWRLDPGIGSEFSYGLKLRFDL